MIRYAEKKDAHEIAPLILVILKDMELPFVARYGDEQTLAVLEAGIVTEDYRYSYRRALVAEIDGQVAGVAFGYSDKAEAQIDKPLKQILTTLGLDPEEKLFTDPETLPGEWYLDTISVSPAFRGHGVGTQLLEALPQIAQRDGEEVIGLSVDRQNPGAKRLYTRMGYETVTDTVISGHDYEHMQRKL